MTEIINPNEETRINEGARVELHFSVAIENGVEIDNTRSREEPVSLVMGDGSLLRVLKNHFLVYVPAIVAQSVFLRKMHLALGTLKTYRLLIPLNSNKRLWWVT